MVVLSPLHHEKIQHMVLYVQCGVPILQSVQIVLDTKRFGFALDRSECSVFKRPMQIPGSKIYSRIRAFQLYHTLITALTHSYSIWGCSKVWVLCINNNKVTHLHITEVQATSFRNFAFCQQCCNMTTGSPVPAMQWAQVISPF